MSLPSGMGDLAATGSLQADVAQKLRVDALRKNLIPGKTKEAKLREACQGFESVFISQLFKEMRATVPKDGMLHGHYEDQYYSMFDKAMCDQLAADGGIGLADMMYRQLKGQVMGKDGKAEPGDILPANRPVPAHGSSLSGVPRIPVPGGAAPTGKRGIPAERFSPEMAAAMARPGVSPLASAHAPTTGTGDIAAAATQAAAPMAAPVNGEITSEYGWRDDPFKGDRAWHAGMDIAAPAGSAVSSCWGGTVVFAGAKGGYGNVVEVEHPGGWKSIYGHLSHYSVKAGDHVAAGGKIAEVGSTGRSTGPHLHFELRRGEGTVDPQRMLAASGLIQDAS
ncbi:Peptidase M23 [Solidesulfovibrio fructosivorans JJ]]|uniref:Peptidase M23 n=1 Tax=Solidesulfovibrio fructosivorans JJ] TaxID=596151 RepID=E1JZC4_SOLFR|nr:peptidoglycan DD-metalloendopeptidase family protein [Solidesulfovibrio fructosivorans]EFL50284.1 Peptidase M23 [Solidesulfovibrio fructosivorans JJ]]